MKTLTQLHKMTALFVINLVGFSFLLAYPTPADAKSSRTKVIDFEGDLIEGVNKLPLDSVNQISEAEKNKHKPHLYQKRKSFGSENSQKLHELRFIK